MATLKTPVGADDQAEGPADAPLTLVEYGDYECSHCGRAYPIVKAVQKHFGNRLRFVFRNFPLQQAHPFAEAAAETAEFAATHGKFWPMHDLLFESQGRFEPTTFAMLGTRLGLDARDLELALEQGRFAERVRHDFSGGVRSGVNGTPTFFINGKRHDDDFELQTLLKALSARLGLSS